MPMYMYHGYEFNASAAVVVDQFPFFIILHKYFMTLALGCSKFMIKFPPEIIKYVLHIINTYMERIRTCHKGVTVSVFLRKPVDICDFLWGGGVCRSNQNLGAG